MTDEERIYFIKKRLKYLFLKSIRSSGNSNQFLDDMIWLLEKAEEGIKKDVKPFNGE